MDRWVDWIINSYLLRDFTWVEAVRTQSERLPLQ